jgi:uncharacterized protein (TIGR02996 family)
MSDRDALLTAILANPDEDTPRLVLADWLDEHGDGNDRVRAKFIRTGCAAARAEPYSQEKFDFTAQAAGIEEKNAHAWADGLVGLALAHRFARGFVEEVTMYSKRFVADGAAVFASQPVRVVKFADTSGNRGVAPPEELFACPLLARIHTLGVTGFGVDDAFIEQLTRSPHVAGLRALRIEKPAINPDALTEVLTTTRLPALTELSLRGSDAVGNAHLAAVANSCEWGRLRVLEFRSCVVGEVGARALADWKHATRLDVLGITHNPLSHSTPMRGPGAVALAESPHLRGLKELVLQGQELRKKGAEAFAAAFAWPGLKRLSLRSNGIPAKVLAAFAANPAFRTLDEFDLSSNPLKARDIEPLRAALPHTAFLLDNYHRMPPIEARP